MANLCGSLSNTAPGRIFGAKFSAKFGRFLCAKRHKVKSYRALGRDFDHGIKLDAVSICELFKRRAGEYCEKTARICKKSDYFIFWDFLGK